MVSRCLKKAVVFSIFAVAIFGFVVSCENPFATNLGSKVDVEPPTISVTAPRAGALLDGTITFEGYATAYRELRSVEVKIFNSDETKPPILDWTNITNGGAGTLSGGAKEKNWTYVLDSINFEGNIEGQTAPGLPDGFLTIQFRAKDPNLTTDPLIYLPTVYFLKNGPSIVKITTPDQSALDKPGEEIPSVLTDKYISGSVTDGRGIKPGYPKIKLWPADKPEPAGNDPNWGWAQLFLTGVSEDTGELQDPSDPENSNTIKIWENPDTDSGFYLDRTVKRVVNNSNFSFRLAEFTIDPDTRHVIYETDENGLYKPLAPGSYKFRIKTSETYSISDKDPEYAKFEDGTSNYMWPRPPKADDGEVEFIGYVPVEKDPLNPGMEAVLDELGQVEPYLFNVRSTGVLPTVELDNSDKTAAELAAVPNVYWDKPTERKIARESANTDFRLQVLAHHPDGIQKAILEYEHKGTVYRSGYLMWDDVGDGYFTPTNDTTKATDGHKGKEKIPGSPADGRLFTFTANGNIKDLVTGAPVFVTDSEPYHMKITVNSLSGLTKEQEYVVYLDGRGPSISIRTPVRGTAKDPEGTIDTATVPGGTIIGQEADPAAPTNFYTVNGNIQVAIERSGSMINSMKWIVQEQDETVYPTANDYLAAASGTILSSLKNYRANPTAANFAFYQSITGETQTQGAIKDGNIGSLISTDRTYNLKFNTSGFNGKYLWLYIIVEDGAHNLGFVLQKLYVNEDTDAPTVEAAGLVAADAAGSAITSANALYDDQVNGENKIGTNVNGQNVFDRRRNINLTFTDDDGISIGATLENGTVVPGGITITLTDLVSAPNDPKTIDAAEFLRGTQFLQLGNSKRWTGSLTPKIMAEAFYGEGRTSLPDGLYKLDVTVWDNLTVKVAITPPRADFPSDTPQAVQVTKTYFFAIKSDMPVITVDPYDQAFPQKNPQKNDMLNRLPYEISGTVKSRLKIQQLSITFKPNVIDPPTLATSAETKIVPLTLYTNAAWTQQAAAFGATTGNQPTQDGDGNYVYYWRIQDVVFDPWATIGGLGDDYPDAREFEVNARDGLNGLGIDATTVRVDTTPPEIILDRFNFMGSNDRGFEDVNGKVPIEISAADAGGIKTNMVGGVERVHLKWWVVRRAVAATIPGAPAWTTAFNPDTGAFVAGQGVTGGTVVAAGWFMSASTSVGGDDMGGGVYRAVINTNTAAFTQSASYDIFAMAEDKAGNFSRVALAEQALRLNPTAITLNQSTDLPHLTEAIRPDEEPIAGGADADTAIKITGRIFDDDLFDLTKARAGNYVAIRFPAGNVNPAGEHPLTITNWGAWLPIVENATTGHTYELSSTGEELTFVFNTKASSYFVDSLGRNITGYKYYQLRFTDEAVAGDNEKPLGKNPDIHKQGLAGYTYTADTTATRYYPGASDKKGSDTQNNEYYNFLFKEGAPSIYFENNDPDKTHPGHLFNPDGVTSARRPSFRTIADLRTALGGPGSYIQEPLFDEAYVYWGEGGVKYPPVTLKDGEGLTVTDDKHAWDTSRFDLTPFNDITADGMYSFTIEAVDKAGQKTRVPWDFYRDTKPPSVTFTNVDQYIDASTATRVIRGTAGDIYVKGRFSDELSDMARYFQYRFDGGETKNIYIDERETETAFDKGYGTFNGRNAVWWAPVPGEGPNDPSFGDGKHTIEVRVADSTGNWADWVRSDFIVDRARPEMSDADSILATVFGVTSQMAAADRVFSSAGLTATPGDVFTLSGLVYEHNLTSLTAVSGPVQVRLPNIEAWNKTGTWSASEISTDGGTTFNPTSATTSRFSITLATAENTAGYDTSIVPREAAGSYANLYVWTFDLRNSDLATIIVPGQSDFQITLRARDMAERDSARKDWAFKLDGDVPTVTFSNITNTNPANLTATPRPSRLESLNVQGEASDNTFVNEVRYNIAKWDYAASAWRYYSNTANQWNQTSALSAYGSTWRNWPNLLASVAPSNSVRWTLNYASLDGFYKTGAQTAEFAEGLYRLEMYVTDTSRSSTAANAGNPTANIQVQFYIDKDEPVVDWEEPDEAKRPGYYRTAAGDTTLRFTASDANTIVAAGAAAQAKVLSVTGKTTGTVIALPAPTVDTATGIVTVTIPVVSLPENPATVAALTSGRYSLILTVQDGSGQKSTSGNTFDIAVDNRAPEITITPGTFSTGAGGNKEAITGRVPLTGKFYKPFTNSPVTHVAYYVASGAQITGTFTPTVPTAENLSNATFLATNNWRFYRETDNRFQLTDNGNVLMEITDGLGAADIIIPNTRYWLNTPYVGAVQTVTAASVTGITFGKDSTGAPVALAGTAEVQKIKIFFLAIDDAGNHSIEECVYWVYPEGDLPVMKSISSPDTSILEAQRLLNGTIRISGIAGDNVRVKNVWFRVLDGTTNAPITLSGIPNWDTATWEAATGTQTAVSKIPYGAAESTGWYMANGGGSSSAPWWAFINNEGELDPLTEGSRRIIVEVMAEDTIWNDSLNSGAGGYETTAGLFGRPTQAAAYVVKDAPRFEREMVYAGKSGDTTYSTTTGYTEAPVGTAGWKNILTSSVKGRASYTVTVRHPSDLKSINWIRGTNDSIDLLDKTAPAAGVTPSASYTYNTGAAGTAGTYAADLAGLDTSTGYGIAAKVQAMRTVAAGFEWDVVIDFNASMLPAVTIEGATVGGWDSRSDRYPIKLSATETSKSVPLMVSKTAEIPIDNQKPEALYTQSSNVAGSAATFGGVARDQGTVSGLDHVVLWFSRRDAGGTYTAISWREKATPAGTFTGGGTVPDGVTLPPGLGMPAISAGTASTGNNDCIVIDRNDPMGNTGHHGHQLPMGWATTGGDMPMSWYVVLNSTWITSGTTYAHYIVYDTAGNATYGSQKLMILNGIPKITTITLGTDIRGDRNLTGATDAEFGTGNSAIANPTAATGGLGRIRTAFSGTGATTDAQMGISEPISINTSRLNAYDVVYDPADPAVLNQAFNVRNKLLAMEVNVEIEGTPSGRDGRHFRVDYVSSARSVSGAGNGDNAIRNSTSGIIAGNVYIINDPGDETNKFPWGSLGVQGEKPQKGTAFLAIENGSSLTLPLAEASYGTPSVWELNSGSRPGGNLAIGDVPYTGAVTTTTPTIAEFVYGSAAFGTAAGTSIVDFNPTANAVADNSDFNADGRPKAYPFPSVKAANGENPWSAHSLFIVRVFEGAETDLFGDFALLSLRVNNNDKTVPYSQMYDLNPKTEGVDTTQTQSAALSPQGMGQNRARGGLWNTAGTPTNVAKSGHIEPRRAVNNRLATSLTSLEMGGAVNAAAATMQKPYANANAFFDYDTVSGEVIVRGYAEDDQRINSVSLQVWNEANTAQVGTTIPILTRRTAAATATQIFLAAADADRVSFTETVDLNRHRVEWAYLWNTETSPGGANVVGNFNLRAVAYNDTNNSATAGTANTRIDFVANMPNRTAYDYYNPNFPASANNFQRYNNIRVNIRPYITGFKRNQGSFSHDTRSRQGRYMFARGEVAVVSGFNLLNSTGNTTIQLTNGTTNSNLATGNTANVTTIGNYGITTANNIRYRQFTVADGAVTGTANGRVTLTVNGYQAVNTGTNAATSERPITNNRPNAIQPWNVEYNPGREGSELWDDFTSVHIWQSNASTANAYDRGVFPKGTYTNPAYPSMTINPSTGTLWSSANEGGGGAAANTGTTVTSANDNTTNGGRTVVTAFIDPIRHSDIFVNASGDRWTVSSIIGRYGGGTAQDYQNHFSALGGIWIQGPDGGNANLQSGVGNDYPQYYGESTYYNSSGWSTPAVQGTGAGTGGLQNPPTTAQFHNPHIITDGTASSGNERIHISYYDEKDGSMKYRYNLRGTNAAVSGNPGNQNANAATVRDYASRNPRTWINLDGGWDEEDNDAAGNVTRTVDIPYAPDRYLREVLVTNGSTVTTGQPIYRFGPRAVAQPVLATASATATTAAANNVAGGSGNSRPFDLTNHGLIMYDVVYVSNSSNETQVPNGEYFVRWSSANQFKLATSMTANNLNPNAANITATITYVRSQVNATGTANNTTANFGGTNGRYFNAANAHGLVEGLLVNVTQSSSTGRQPLAERYVRLDGTNTTRFGLATAANAARAQPNANDTVTITYNRFNFTTITAPATGTITLNYTTAAQNNGNYTTQPANNATVATVAAVGGARLVNQNSRATTNAGKHNSIALTSQGYPVIAYFDEANQVLKMAVSNSQTPAANSNWRIIGSARIFNNATHQQYQNGTGEYVSLKIDTRTGATQNTFHIAALNSTNKNLVYIRGTLSPPATSGGAMTDAYVTVDTVQIVDSVGNVGRWCNLSLDAAGNPWIAYHDESYRGSKDGVKVAYYNAATFTKGNNAAPDAYIGRTGQDIDLYGTAITGWEAMHVPTQTRVDDARLGMERFPTIRIPNQTRTNGFSSFAAVGYLGEDRYNIAYYVE